MQLCRERGIEAILDDGLFIMGSHVAVGRSAKRQETKVGAVKAALYLRDEHRDEVMAAIRESAPESILVLGTSEEMVLRICARLELPEPAEMIPIEAITTEAERALAAKQRMEKGRHVIPAPTFQLKRQFSGYVLSPLRFFRSRGGRPQEEERTVLRPTYSYLGEYFISDRVIRDLVEYAGRGIEGVSQVQRVITENASDGVSISLLLRCSYGSRLMEVGRQVQERVAQEVETMTAFNVLRVDVEIRSLT